MKNISYRYLLLVVMCIGSINMYAQRMCLTIAVICMTNHSAELALLENNTDYDHLPNRTKSLCGETSSSDNQMLQDGTYIWEGQTRAHVLGMFFWGYLVMQIPSGFITQKYGSRHVVLMCLVLLGLSTGLIPFALKIHIYLLYALRIIAGIASASWFPAFYQIWASWAPPKERGILVGLSFAGIHIGSCLTLPIAGALCQTRIGWPLVFYFYGVVGLAYALMWALLVYNTPSQHPRISDAEKKYIISKCGDCGTRKQRKSNVPVLAIISSLPVWAFFAVNMGNDYNTYTLMTTVPAYMKEVLAFDINENAGLSALPYLGFWFGQLISGWASDKILVKELLPVAVVRKLMTAIGMFCPGICMILISLFDCRHKYVVVFLFTVGLVLNSAVLAGGMLNPIEISPRHAGLIFAGANTLGALTGVIAPLVAGLLTPNKSYDEWRYVFYVSAAVYIVTGAFFVLCSSSKIQSWAIDRTDYWSSGEYSFQVQQDEKIMRNSEPVACIPKQGEETRDTRLFSSVELPSRALKT